MIIGLVGIASAITFNLLKSILSSKLSVNTSLEITQIFTHGRHKAMAEGKTITFIIDRGNQKMGLKYYNPSFERAEDEELDRLAQTKAQDSYRLRELIEKINEQDDSKDKDKKEEKEKWIVENANLPNNIQGIYSLSGLKITNRVLYIHFYPNGTSDGIIIEFENKKNKYLYLSRYNIPAKYTKQLHFSNSQK